MTELPSPIDPTNLQAEYFVEEIIEAFNMLLHYVAETQNQRYDGVDWVYINPPKAGDPVSDLVVKGDNANTDVANPPSDPKRKANT